MTSVDLQIIKSALTLDLCLDLKLVCRKEVKKWDTDMDRRLRKNQGLLSQVCKSRDPGKRNGFHDFKVEVTET